MGILDRLEEEYLDVSRRRRTLRELLELLVGAVLFVLLATALTRYLLGEDVAFAVAIGLSIVFAVTLLSQAYWAVRGREEYEDEDEEG